MNPLYQPFKISLPLLNCSLKYIFLCPTENKFKIHPSKAVQISVKTRGLKAFEAKVGSLATERLYFALVHQIALLMMVRLCERKFY